VGVGGDEQFCVEGGGVGEVGEEDVSRGLRRWSRVR
jgi:hypothetical protein